MARFLHISEFVTIGVTEGFNIQFDAYFYHLKSPNPLPESRHEESLGQARRENPSTRLDATVIPANPEIHSSQRVEKREPVSPQPQAGCAAKELVELDPALAEEIQSRNKFWKEPFHLLPSQGFHVESTE